MSMPGTLARAQSPCSERGTSHRRARCARLWKRTPLWSSLGQWFLSGWSSRLTLGWSARCRRALTRKTCTGCESCCCPRSASASTSWAFSARWSRCGSLTRWTSSRALCTPFATRGFRPRSPRTGHPARRVCVRCDRFCHGRARRSRAGLRSQRACASRSGGAARGATASRVPTRPKPSESRPPGRARGRTTWSTCRSTGSLRPPARGSGAGLSRRRAAGRWPPLRRTGRASPRAFTSCQPCSAPATARSSRGGAACCPASSPRAPPASFVRAIGTAGSSPRRQRRWQRLRRRQLPNSRGTCRGTAREPTPSCRRTCRR
mmetsp:Transcript_20714/g.79470  ORF Transcript_20714/g.79470 Transcript_20714/m.79470 type:complete len:319 (+) Transcript_20714:141-1097(+)